MSTQNLVTIDSLMKRGHLALEDSNWHQANQYFDKALDIDPEYAPAYVGKVLSTISIGKNGKNDWVNNNFFLDVIRKEADLARYYKPLDDMPDYQKAIRFANGTYRAQLESYNSQIKKRIAELKKDFGFYMIIVADVESGNKSVEDGTWLYSGGTRYKNVATYYIYKYEILVGNFSGKICVEILRTGESYMFSKDEWGKIEVSCYVYNNNYDIKAGDVAVITNKTIEYNRRRKEQEERERQEKEEQEERERQKKYESLIQTRNRISTEEEYKDLAEQFRGMYGYKNTKELARECDNKYIELKNRREEQKRYRQEAEVKIKHRLLTIWWTILGGIIGGLVFALAGGSGAGGFAGLCAVVFGIINLVAFFFWRQDAGTTFVGFFVLPIIGAIIGAIMSAILSLMPDIVFLIIGIIIGAIIGAISAKPQKKRLLEIIQRKEQEREEQEIIRRKEQECEEPERKEIKFT